MDSKKTPEQNQITLSETESSEVLVDIGSLVFEAALGRLLLTLDETQLSDLEQYLEDSTQPEKLADYLLTEYPVFQQFIDEEAKELEEKAEVLNA